MSDGVPPLANSSDEPVPQVIITGDKLQNGSAQNVKIWGIYQNRVAVIVPDSVISVEYKFSTRVSDYPVEEGNFVSYNKVQEPYHAKIRMAKSTGGVDERSLFINQVDNYATSTELVDIITPDAVFINANITNYSYVRTSTNGANMIIVDIDVEEIRLVASSAFSNTQAPDGAGPIVSGSLIGSVSPSVYFTPQ